MLYWWRITTLDPQLTTQSGGKKRLPIRFEKFRIRMWCFGGHNIFLVCVEQRKRVWIFRNIDRLRQRKWLSICIKVKNRITGVVFGEDVINYCKTEMKISTYREVFVVFLSRNQNLSIYTTAKSSRAARKWVNTRSWHISTEIGSDKYLHIQNIFFAGHLYRLRKIRAVNMNVIMCIRQIIFW